MRRFRGARSAVLTDRVAVAGDAVRDDAAMAAGSDRGAAIATILLAVAVAVVGSPTAAAGNSRPPQAPAATAHPVATAQSGSGTVRGGRDDRTGPTGTLVVPSTESDDVTKLLLALLAGIVVLIVIPTQVAKGIAQRRAVGRSGGPTRT